MLIQEAKRLQQLAGLKEGHYYTSTEDPKTAQLHLTTDKGPSLSKSYEPLSPKSQRKKELTPSEVEKALVSALKNNKMDYEKSISSVSDKYSLSKDKLQKDFPKNDLIYKAGTIDEIVNEVLENFRVNEEENNIEQSIDKELQDFLGNIKSAALSMKPSPKDKELKEGLMTITALIAGAPGLISLLGKGADAIAQYFSGGAVQKTKIGTFLQKKGHKWEDKYIQFLGFLLKKAYPESYKDENPLDKSTALYKAAHGIYAAILAAAAIGSGVEAANATSTIIKALEGGAAAFKTSEVAQLAQKIASA